MKENSHEIPTILLQWIISHKKIERYTSASALLLVVFLSIINSNDLCKIYFLFLSHAAWVFLHVLWNCFFFFSSPHNFWHVLYDLQSGSFFINCELHEKVNANPSHHPALIFSQLPHPECWMPRSHWRLSKALGLFFFLLGSRYCKWASHSALWSMCGTVVILPQ